MVNGGITITAVDRVVEETAHDQALIPADVQIESVELRRAVEVVLLVEKEAIFKRLDLGEGGGRDGKGYPDVATQELLATLSNTGAPVFALVDLDPHGIEIMATVRFSNQAMTHQGPWLRVEGLR